MHMDTQQDGPIDAEIIEETTVVEMNGGEMVVNLEQMIKTNISAVDASKNTMKKYKEMLNDIILNDPTFQEHEKVAQAANKVRAKTKSEILQQPQAKDLRAKIKDLGFEIKEATSALSDYLKEYQRLAGVNEIECDDGEVREIINSAKLIKKNQKFGR